MVDAIYNKKNSNVSDFLLTGYSKLDELMGGLQNSDLIVIAARPSMGNSPSNEYCARHCFQTKKESWLF